ncbi:Synaptotagmin-4 [Anabarilius grahami]|uniref:Synaptotagmin-4 n=1 Tax=Anabarilius grahami TaxID=495550 RepID=A0A3N0Y7K9_ANAGA|nr:Synaptotagmin-4 [Anabarilius grahami]
MQVELEAHLQILLAVGLAVLCFCLVIGCIICCWHRKSHPTDDKEAGLSLPPLPADHVTVTLSPSPSINTLPIKQQYEELDGDVLDYPSFNSSSTPSEDDLSFTSLSGPPKSHFTLRRLSSPIVSSKPTKPAVRVRSSLPTIPKLSLKSQKRKNGNISYTESSRLKADNNQHYGSNSHKPTPSLHFTLLFSPSDGKLTVTVLGLYRGSRKLSGATVRACLPPLCPTPLQDGRTRRRSLSPDAPAQVFQLQVRSAEELQSCTLRLTVSSRDFSGLRETAVGELELACAEIHWEPDSTVTFNCQLNPARRRLRKSQSSHDAVGDIRASVSPVRFLGQILILLQYQTLAHRMKVMVRKAENLPKLTRMPGTPDHYVVINLRQDGKVISTKETKGASGANAVWNAPFLFDLPAGDISRLPLLLELIVMQGRLYTKSCILGRVLIGYEGSEAGNQHWSEMCSRAQVETVYWHELQPDTS